MENKLPEDYGFVKTCVQDLGASSHQIESPFSLNAEDFLYFAEKDIKGDDDKDIINALSNAKRSIENRMDLLLYAFGYDLKEKLNFPSKLEELNKLGIIAPRILKKINKIRNLLEHNYEKPDKEKVEDSIDIAILFVEYTNKFIYNFRDYLDGNCNGKCFKITFEEGGIKINYNKEKLFIKYKDPVFHEWVNFVIEVGYWLQI